ncbi:hypothetical protein PBF_24473 [Cytobacillus firmus DS1]|uniref:Uncharacterized protein n=1 Tax=Cytobacillus firmus DS1 TaxID=1307436 RepID=W7KQG8_CYTFI|nr:hypothetical protein PBF_24473 [Cytobacillus firmus DS1]
MIFLIFISKIGFCCYSMFYFQITAYKLFVFQFGPLISAAGFRFPWGGRWASSTVRVSGVSPVPLLPLDVE